MTSHHLINDIQDIKAHLEETRRLHVPVTICINQGKKIDNCQLEFDLDKECLFVRLPSAIKVSSGMVEVNYVLSHMVYTFTCPIICDNAIKDQIKHISLQLPDKITSLDRRVYMRIKISPDEPILFDINLPHNKSVQICVEDISGGGIGFYVHKDMNLFEIGKVFPACLKLSGLAPLNTHIEIRNIKQIFNLYRIGAEFVGISTKQRMAVIEYTIKKQSRQHILSEKDQLAQDAHILIIEKSTNKSIFSHLDSAYDVTRSSLKQLSTDMMDQKPDLIILDLDIPNSAKVLQKLQQLESFHKLPFILISKKHQKCAFSNLETKFITIPVKESYISNTIQALVGEYRLSRKFEIQNISHGKACKILLLDSNGNFCSQTVNLLKKNHYEVMTIKGKINIIKQITEFAPDVILINETEDGQVEPICKLISFNKIIKPIPRILICQTKKIAQKYLVNHIASRVLISPISTADLVSEINIVLNH